MGRSVVTRRTSSGGPKSSVAAFFKYWMGSWRSSLKRLNCWRKAVQDLISYSWIFNAQPHVHLKKWTLKFKLLCLLNHSNCFNNTGSLRLLLKPKSKTWQILGAILRAVAMVWEAAEIELFFGHANNARFHGFRVGQILRHLNTTTSIGEAMKTFGTEFWKFYHRGSFFNKRKNCPQNFQVLQFQAVITPPWLQIAGNSLQNGPSTDV